MEDRLRTGPGWALVLGGARCRPYREQLARVLRRPMASARGRVTVDWMWAWRARISADSPTWFADGLARRGGRRGTRHRGDAGPCIGGLLAVTGLAAVMVLAGCARADQDLQRDRILRHGDEFAVGTFDFRAVQPRSAGVVREGTLVVDQNGCLALQPSSTPDAVRVLAVPVGSFISEHGTVYVAEAVPDEAGHTGGPVMAGRMGNPVRFTGPEVILGGEAGQGVVMPPPCSAAGVRVLLVTP